MRGQTKMRNVFDKKLILYCIVGITNYIICTGLMFLLFNLNICDEHIAPLVNYGLGGIIWYFGNVKLVFTGQKQTPALVIRFICEILACYLLCYYVLAPLICTLILNNPGDATQGNVRMAIGSVLYAIVNYFGQRFFVFREFNREKRRRRAEHAKWFHRTEE